MTVRRLAVLQWIGLLVGALVWAGQHVVGFGITAAGCNAGGGRWGIENDLWQGTLAAISALVVVGAGAAAVAVVVKTQDVSYEDGPPIGRVRFFAIAAVAANVIFLMIILLDGVASIVDPLCRQA